MVCRARGRAATLALALALVGLSSLSGAASAAVFGVVVANNRSTDASLPTLRFADDDGAKFYELLATLGQRVELLTVLDPESQRRYPELRSRARPPRAAEVRAALARVFAAIRAANARGERTVFYFVFSGHGSVDASGQGTIHLLDGAWRRGRFIREVVAASPATINHVLVDACQAYFVVHRKGGGRRWRQDRVRVDYRGLLRRFLRNERLERYPNTGVLLATSRGAETHEWARFEGGLFSHLVRSAMTGAADANTDRAVSYSELAAYVAAANARVSNARARVNLFARPPAQHLDEPVVRLDAPALHRLRIGQKVGGRFYIEDRRGARYADFHKAPEAPLTVVLLGRRGHHYYLRGGGGERRIVLADGLVEVLKLGPSTSTPRGAVADALRRGLFAVAYGPTFHAGYASAWRRTLGEPLPAVADLPPGKVAADVRRAAPAATARSRRPAPAGRWRLRASYLLGQPALDRAGAAHGLELQLRRRLGRWLELGAAAHYAAAAGPGWRQQRLAGAVVLGAELPARSWLGLAGQLGLGYLGLFEDVAAQPLRGDPAGLAGWLDAGPSLHLRRWLSLAARGRLALDLLEVDGARRLRPSVALLLGLEATL